MTDFPQLRILHVSDIHFGTNHICRPSESTGSAAGIPTLRDLISKDLADAEWEKFCWATPSPNEKPTRLLLVMSGDLTHTADTADPNEFNQAYDFRTGLIEKPILGTKVTLEDVFIVPGNHDVVFTRSEPAQRFQPYCTFYNRLFQPIVAKRPYAYPNQADTLSRIHEFPDEHLPVAEINSSYYVEKETLDESRGQVDFAAIASLRATLKGLAEKAKDWIKIALVHHHPVLLPSFIEAGRSVDAILNAKSLLGLVRGHGFQLILHGHKHFPQVFSYDPDPAWATTETPIPQLIVAVGSPGSETL